MLPVTSTVVRLTLHVLAATVWVGGQFTLAGLLPSLRAAGPDVPAAAARAFNRVAWPAFGVLVATGVWNVAVVRRAGNIDYDVTLAAKLGVVALSGLSAVGHARTHSRPVMAVLGALSGITAVGAVFLGVLLSHG